MADLSAKFDKAKDLSAAFDALPGEQPSQSDYSTLGAGAMGAVKGATFGFDDEIGGIAKALYDKGVKGKKEDFWDLYTKVRDSIREEHKAAEEQHPVASFAGELVGGIAPMVAAPASLVGKGAAAGANYLTKAKALGTTGAKVGALAGLGTSEADLTKGQVGQATEDVAGGAASGAIMGGVVIPAVEKAGATVGKEAWNRLKQFPMVEDIGSAIKSGMRGDNLVGKQNEATKMTNQVAQGVADTLEQLRSDTGAARQLAVEAATDSGVTVDPHAWADRWIAEADAKLSGASKNEVQDILDFKNKIKSIVKETTREIDTFVPLESGLTPDQKALESVRAKMTKSSLADNEQSTQIIKGLKDDINTGKLNPNDQADLARMQQLLAKAESLAKGNEFAPEIQAHPSTEMEGVVNPRGGGKTPVVEPIRQNPFDAKVAHIVSQVTERETDTLTPTEISKIATDLGNAYKGYTEPNEHLGRSLFGGAKQELQKMMENAAKLSPEAKEDAVTAFNKALEGFKDETGKFINVAKTQEKLSQPGFAAVSGEADKVLRLQNMIQNYNKPGSNARLVLDQAIDELAKAYPQEAAGIRQLIKDTAKNRDISMGLSAQSPLATNIVHASAKAILMNIANLGGMAYGGLLNVGRSTASKSEDLVKIGNKIYGASPEMIQSMADKAMAMGGAFGNMVAKTLGGITDAPQYKQRAVLFTLMQQPDFRRFAQEQMNGEQK